MLSKIPYLIDAIRNWAIDSALTPQLLVDSKNSAIVLPLDQIKSGDGDSNIVLNIHEQAVDRFQYRDDHVVFRTRFSGRSFEVDIPFDAVIAVFTRETHEGLHLQAIARAETEVEDGEVMTDKTPGKTKPASGKPHLKVVK